MPTKPMITWTPPALLLAGMLVDSALNATASAAGTFAYDPPAGTIAASAPTVAPFTAVAPMLTIACTFTPDDLVTYSVATATVTIPLQTAYLIPSDSRSLMAGMPAAFLGNLPSQPDAALIGLALAASQDIDVAMRYQGRKLIETQEREFPRLAYGPAPITRQFAMGYPGFFGLVYPFSADTRIWDLDLGGATTGTVTAVVPTNVRVATVYQMAWLNNPANAARLESIRAGILAKGVGSASVQYAAAAGLAATGGLSGLGDRAFRLMDKYRLRSGRLL